MSTTLGIAPQLLNYRANVSNRGHVEIYQMTCHIKEHQLDAVASGNRGIGIVIGLGFEVAGERSFPWPLPSPYSCGTISAAKGIGLPAWIFSARTMPSSHASPEGTENILRPLAAIPRGYRVL
jgi:hypothetical protein